MREAIRAGADFAVKHARHSSRKQRLPGPAELLPGLAVGDVRAVGADLEAAMKASGLSHLTALSGPTA